MNADRANELVLTPAAADSVRRGHPWVWDKGVARGAQGLAAGAEVIVLGPDHARLGRGVYEPGSPIAVRIWSHAADEPLDAKHVTAKLAAAAQRRSDLFHDGTTTAYRLVHGEGDRTPGLVVDRYGDIAIVKLDGLGAEGMALRLREALVASLRGIGLETIVVRRGGKGEQPAFEVWASSSAAASSQSSQGAASGFPATVTVMEGGVPFVVDLVRGQKTGAFLDQRDNRRRVGAMARGKRVLNLFSYAGGFSLHAAHGGATRVTSVDIAAQAHGTAQASFRAAGLDPRQHGFVTADVFAYLASAAQRHETWDLVISDPPSFAPSARSLPRALTAYRALHQAAVRVLADGGTFCAASCSSHVGAEAFLTTLDDATLAPRQLSLQELHGPPPDHPTVPGWPEGRYLKFAVLR